MMRLLEPPSSKVDLITDLELDGTGLFKHMSRGVSIILTNAGTDLYVCD